MTTQARTLGEMVLAATERHAGTAIRWPGGEWSFADLGAAVRELAGGLAGLGLQPGDRVALLAETRPEWTLADCAILAAGGVVVPVYHTNSPEECKYVIEHSGARMAIVEDAAQLDKIERLSLDHAVTIEPTGRARTLADLRAAGGELRPPGADPDDVATIVYTSGTTGPPKGCMLTHRNFLATAAAYEQQVGLEAPFSLFMFLPLAHALARVVEFVALDAGGTLAFWGGDPKRLVDDVAAAKPTHFPSVPRVFEKIHARALASAAEGGKAKARLFAWAIATGRKQRRFARRGSVPPGLRAQHALADRLVLSRVRDLFGGQLELALTGAAPIALEVLEFLDACGVTVLEGYGMTETTAAATLNTRDQLRFGTVGRALPGTGVDIAPDGEVLLSGPNVFQGYYRDDEGTAETLVDGRVRTGDLGELDADGFLRITGRKKDIIITSSGKNVTPSNLESALRESRWISQAIVHGDNRPYLVALLTLDPDELDALAAEVGVEGADPAAMAADERVRAALQRDVDAANARFARIEQIKRFTVLEQDLSQENGELTPTMKVKRNVVAERYRDLLEELYG